MAPLRAFLVLLVTLAACGTPTPPGRALSLPELKYLVFNQIGRPWYCDPDFYPIARADERDLALLRFPEIQKDAATYQAILDHNGLVAATTDEQKLTVYRDWKQLNALRLEADGSTYRFAYRAQPKTSGGQGALAEGTIDAFGAISIAKQQPSGPPPCPICLADDSRIDTPRGEVPITALREGEPVWTLDAAGRQVAAPIVALGSTVAPAGHEVVALVLSDGRAVRLSAGHPLVDGRRAGDLRVGDALDGSVVTSVARRPYAGETHDLLPAGASGAYWANGVLLASSLR